MFLIVPAYLPVGTNKNCITVPKDFARKNALKLEDNIPKSESVFVAVKIILT